MMIKRANFIMTVMVTMLSLVCVSTVSAAQSSCGSKIELFGATQSDSRTCIWDNSGDGTMQLQVKLPENAVAILNLNCSFTPADGSTDELNYAVGKKNLSYSPPIKASDNVLNGNSEYNDKASPNNNHGNYLFYLKSKDVYTANDSMHCTVTWVE